MYIVALSSCQQQVSWVSFHEHFSALEADFDFSSASPLHASGSKEMLSLLWEVYVIWNFLTLYFICNCHYLKNSRQGLLVSSLAFYDLTLVFTSVERE